MTGRRCRTTCRHAPVSGIVVQEHFNDLVVGTYGRGFWILDDLAPIQQMTPEVIASGSHLFELRDAYRFRPTHATVGPLLRPDRGHGIPEYGASINYWLGAAGVVRAHGRESWTVTGAVVRTLTGTNHAGVNRIHWDLT